MLAMTPMADSLRLIGRSLNDHRPSGVFTARSKEPDARGKLREGAR